MRGLEHRGDSGIWQPLCFEARVNTCHFSIMHPDGRLYREKSIRVVNNKG